jgi:hypothetical protein
VNLEPATELNRTSLISSQMNSGSRTALISKCRDPLFEPGDPVSRVPALNRASTNATVFTVQCSRTATAVRRCVCANGRSKTLARETGSPLREELDARPYLPCDAPEPQPNCTRRQPHLAYRGEPNGRLDCAPSGGDPSALVTRSGPRLGAIPVIGIEIWRAM